MLLVKTSNGVVEQYPYTISDLYHDNPHTSFPKTVSKDALANYSVYEVTPTTRPEYNHLVQSVVCNSEPHVESGEWVIGYTVENKTQDLAETNVRNYRSNLLSKTDWMATTDNTMTTAMAEYRQALRDITSQEGFPYDVTWPTKPE
jgi:hypothetical protein